MPPARIGAAAAPGGSRPMIAAILLRSGRVALLQAIVCALVAPGALGAQVGGDLAAYPAADLHLRITTTPSGPHLSAETFELVTGKYYALNVASDGETDWRLEVGELLASSHLRVLTIDGIEVHLQGMSFRAIEFDEPGTARFTFTPIRPGEYPFTVGSVPSAAGRPIGAAGVSERGQAAHGRFVVR